jgi:uncharacterized membrane protein
MTDTLQEYENIHGRRPGRGVRPYLLVLKLFVIAVYVGTLTAVLALVFLHGRPTDARLWEFEMSILERAYRLLVIPSICVTLLMGLLLWSSHARAFLRMRWLQAKLVLVIMCLPALHLPMRHWMHRLDELVPPDGGEAVAEAIDIRSRLVGGSAAALSLAVVLIMLGRIKPRLGQDYGRTFAQGRSPEPPTTHRQAETKQT